MNDFKVCRICLVTDVKMHNLLNYPLNNYFEAVIGSITLALDPVPAYACYECAELVKKYYYFRDRCMRAQDTLYCIIQSQGQITKDVVLQINRKELYLTSNLTTHYINEDSFYNFNESHIKQEVEDGLYEIKSEYIDIQIKDVTTLESSDDEPLSVHKEKKKKIKKVETDLFDDDKFGIKDFEGIEANEDTELLSEITEIVRKKRGRPRGAGSGKPRRSSDKPRPSAGKPRPPRPAPRARRTVNTGGVDTDLGDDDISEYADIITLTIEEQLEDIQKRKESSNYKNGTYKCNTCYKGFIDLNAYNHHMTKHEPKPGSVPCAVCHIHVPSARALQKHVVNHEKKYACRACPYVSKSTSQAKHHQRWHKGVTYKCQYCDDISTTWTSYLSHVRMKHRSQHVCGTCGYSFVSRLGLSMHRTMMHADEKTPEKAPSESGLYCEACDVHFDNAQAWRRHLHTATRHAAGHPASTTCVTCGEACASAEELRLHVRRQHARARPRGYGKRAPARAWPAACAECGEAVPDARALWTHYRRLHPDKHYPIQKNHVCDVCGKSFRGNAFLVYHKRTHSSERQFQCSACPKAFHNRSNLSVHMKAHSDCRPYPCASCSKAFKSKGGLRRHERCHTGDKPYVCEVCGKAFGQSNSRKLHVRSVHRRQPAPVAGRQ